MANKHDILFRRDGTNVVVNIETDLPHPKGDETVYLLRYECGSTQAAELLYRYLETRHSECIRAIRRAEYNAGWKDAKSHTARKATYFGADMRQRALNC